jgi:hypothetical protein
MEIHLRGGSRGDLERRSSGRLRVAHKLTWEVETVGVGVLGAGRGWWGGLISAPLIPEGVTGLRRSPVESRGLKIGREACQFFNSGSFSVR